MIIHDKFIDGAVRFADPGSSLLGHTRFYKRNNVQRVFEPLYPNLQIKTSREAGHYLMLETPVLAATEVERFLGQPGREQ